MYGAVEHPEDEFDMSGAGAFSPNAPDGTKGWPGNEMLSPYQDGIDAWEDGPPRQRGWASYPSREKDVSTSRRVFYTVTDFRMLQGV